MNFDSYVFYDMVKSKMRDDEAMKKSSLLKNEATLAVKKKKIESDEPLVAPPCPTPPPIEHHSEEDVVEEEGHAMPVPIVVPPPVLIPASSEPPPAPIPASNEPLPSDVKSPAREVEPHEVKPLPAPCKSSEEPLAVACTSNEELLPAHCESKDEQLPALCTSKEEQPLAPRTSNESQPPPDIPQQQATTEPWIACRRCHYSHHKCIPGPDKKCAWCTERDVECIPRIIPAKRQPSGKQKKQPPVVDAVNSDDDERILASDEERAPASAPAATSSCSIRDEQGTPVVNKEESFSPVADEKEPPSPAVSDNESPPSPVVTEKKPKRRNKNVVKEKKSKKSSKKCEDCRRAHRPCEPHESGKCVRCWRTGKKCLLPSPLVESVAPPKKTPKRAPSVSSVAIPDLPAPNISDPPVQNIPAPPVPNIPAPPIPTSAAPPVPTSAVPPVSKIPALPVPTPFGMSTTTFSALLGRDYNEDPETAPVAQGNNLRLMNPAMRAKIVFPTNNIGRSIIDKGAFTAIVGQEVTYNPFPKLLELYDQQRQRTAVAVMAKIMEKKMIHDVDAFVEEIMGETFTKNIPADNDEMLYLKTDFHRRYSMVFEKKSIETRRECEFGNTFGYNVYNIAYSMFVYKINLSFPALENLKRYCIIVPDKFNVWTLSAKTIAMILLGAVPVREKFIHDYCKTYGRIDCDLPVIEDPQYKVDFPRPSCAQTTYAISDPRNKIPNDEIISMRIIFESLAMLELEDVQLASIVVVPDDMKDSGLGKYNPTWRKNVARTIPAVLKQLFQ